MAKTPVKIPGIPAFIQTSTPCKEGKQFLEKHQSLHAAWMADDVRLDHMLWALCEAKSRQHITQRKFNQVCDELLTKLSDRLNAASLTLREFEPSPVLDNVKFHNVLTQIMEIALKAYSHPVWGVLNAIQALITAPADASSRTVRLYNKRRKLLDNNVLSYGRDLMRARFPGMFKEYW